MKYRTKFYLLLKSYKPVINLDLRYLYKNIEILMRIIGACGKYQVTFIGFYVK